MWASIPWLWPATDVKLNAKKKSETELEYKLKDEPEAPVASQGATYYENLKCAAVLLSFLLNMIA